MLPLPTNLATTIIVLRLGQYTDKLSAFPPECIDFSLRCLLKDAENFPASHASKTLIKIYDFYCTISQPCLPEKEQMPNKSTCLLT